MEYGCIPDNYEQIRFSRLVRLVNVGYKYIFGTVVAYYALQHSTLEKMVYLNNHINDAKNVCSQLDIPHYVFNVTEEFEKEVMDYFVEMYDSGKWCDLN